MAPAIAQENGSFGACRTASTQGFFKCFDDLSQAACNEKSGQWAEDTPCSEAPNEWEGACLTSGLECCLIDSGSSDFSAEEICLDGEDGFWSPVFICTEIPVELQSFDVDR